MSEVEEKKVEVESNESKIDTVSLYPVSVGQAFVNMFEEAKELKTNPDIPIRVRKTPQYTIRAHNEYLKRNLEVKKFTCTMCDKPFRDPYTLKKHMQSIKHNPRVRAVESFNCALCGLDTSNKYNYKAHLETTKHKKRELASRGMINEQLAALPQHEEVENDQE